MFGLASTKKKMRASLVALRRQYGLASCYGEQRRGKIKEQVLQGAGNYPLWRQWYVDTRALVDGEETALECAAATAEERRGEKEINKAMPLTEVVRNCSHNICVPLPARLANANNT
jgi:hypothetical protein